MQIKKREWDRNRQFVRIRFRRPTSAQLSRAVKADEISVVEPTQPTASCSTIQHQKEARILSRPLFVNLYELNDVLPNHVAKELHALPTLPYA